MIWWIEQIDWMIFAPDSEEITFGLTTNLLCIFDI